MVPGEGTLNCFNEISKGELSNPVFITFFVNLENGHISGECEYSV
jgi:hypothetical protein